MSGKHTQTDFEGEREDDVSGVPHGAEEGDQDSKGVPDSGRQDAETTPDP